MTKEISKEWLVKQFVRIANSYSSNSAVFGMYKQVVDEATLIADEFFSQNVVIPKGENRHPYADVLHEWIEGVCVEIFKGNSWNELGRAEAYFNTISLKYRIKPQEPVYEWQWECYSEEGLSFISKVHMTEDEASLLKVKLYKIEETKRARQ